MDWQQLVSLFIVAAAGGLLAWGRVRRRGLGLRRATHCGCPGAGRQAGERGSIVFRARAGSRPVVTVKL